MVEVMAACAAMSGFLLLTSASVFITMVLMLMYTEGLPLATIAVHLKKVRQTRMFGGLGLTAPTLGTIALDIPFLLAMTYIEVSTLSLLKWRD
jgi:hypothetical protein